MNEGKPKFLAAPRRRFERGPVSVFAGMGKERIITTCLLRPSVAGVNSRTYQALM